MIDTLKRRHRELRTASGELLALLGSDIPCDWDRLAQVRWNLVRLQIEQKLAGHRLIKRRLERDPRPQVAFAVRRYAGQREADLVRLEDHLTYWTRARIEGDWSGFTAATRQLVARAMESMDIHPLASPSAGNCLGVASRRTSRETLARPPA